MTNSQNNSMYCILTRVIVILHLFDIVQSLSRRTILDDNNNNKDEMNAFTHNLHVIHKNKGNNNKKKKENNNNNNNNIRNRNRNLYSLFQSTLDDNDNGEDEKTTTIMNKLEYNNYYYNQEEDNNNNNSNDIVYPRGIMYRSDICPIGNEVTTTNNNNNNKNNNATETSNAGVVVPQTQCSLSNGQIGAWVCRQVFDIVTGERIVFTACADTNRYIATDLCGCCYGICPVFECKCTCDLSSSSSSPNKNNNNNNAVGDSELKGVLINTGIILSNTKNYTTTTTNNNKNDQQEYTNDESIECVDRRRAYQLITGPGLLRRPTCYEGC